MRRKAAKKATAKVEPQVVSEESQMTVEQLINRAIEHLDDEHGESKSHNVNLAYIRLKQAREWLGRK